MQSDKKIRTGDEVLSPPFPDGRDRETWVVAYADYERNELAACGWPLGIVKLDQCELSEPCSDEEHVEWVRRVWTMGRDEQGFMDPRARAVRRLYPELAPADEEVADTLPPEAVLTAEELAQLVERAPQVVEAFDAESVAEYMGRVGWQWYGEGVPGPERIRAQAMGLFHGAFREIPRVGVPFTTKTGGLVARIERFRLQLEFVPVESSCRFFEHDNAWGFLSSPKRA